MDANVTRITSHCGYRLGGFCLGLGLMLGVPVLPASAQDVPPAAGLLQGQRPGEIPIRDLPEAEPDLITVPPVIDRGTEAADSIVIQVQRFELDGAQDHPDQDFRVADLMALLEQRRQEADGQFDIFALEDLALEITRYYRERGFVIAQAYLPAQDVENGVVTIGVLEGRLGDVTIDTETPHRYKDRLLLAPFTDDVGDIVHKDALEGSLLTLRDYPGLDAFGIFRAGQEVGETELVLKINEEKRYAAAVTIDNHGSELSGEWRLRGDLALNNPLNLGDRLDLSLLQTFEPSNSLFGSVGYRIPIWGPRTLAGLGYTRDNFDVGSDFAALNISGESETAELYLEQQFHRGRQFNLLGRLGLARKQSTIEQDGVQISDDILSVVTLTASFDRLDRFNGINVGLVRYSHGLPGTLGALEDNDPESSRRSGEDEFAGGDFDKLELSYTRLQSLPWGSNQSLLFRLFGQYTGDLLVPLEQMSLGGPDSVRAYPRSEFLRDRGVFTSLEWIIPAPGFQDKPAFRNLLWGQVFQLSVYADYAKGWLIDPLGSEEEEVELGGIGFGLRFEVPGEWLARFQMATPFTSLDPSNDRDPQLFLDVSYQF